MLAIYLRISEEDFDIGKTRLKSESNSITAQRDLVLSYIQSHFPDESVEEFCDDGYTGTNFDRPSFQKMIELARKGKISCILVKDLSRFGRDYLEVGNYIDYVFPFLGVRLISINDGYDSAARVGATGGLDVSLRNLIYDNYSKDLSKKVRSAMRTQMRRGKFVNVPPYGYTCSPVDKHQLVIDPEPASIVREIFTRFLNGTTTAEIAKELNRREIPTPQLYKQTAAKSQKGKKVMWTHYAVLAILQCLKYTGAMTNHMVENPYIRAKNYRRLPKSEWIITEDAHEAIVTKREFDQAQEMIRKVRPAQKKPSGIPNVFYCAHCGRKLSRTHGLETYFSCRSPYVHDGMEQCRAVRWKRGDLEAVLIALFEKQVSAFLEQQSILRQRIREEQPEQFRKETTQLHKELERLSSDKVVQYARYRDKKLSREDFLELKQQMNKREQEIEQQLKEIQQRQEEQSVLQAAAQSGEQLADQLNSADREQIKQIMYRLIDRVTVFSDEEIEVSWKFSDAIQEVEKRQRIA